MHMSWVAILMGFICFIWSCTLSAQPGPGNPQFRSPVSNLWLGGYGKIRLSENLFWDAQFHFRTEEFQNTRVIGRVSQIYNRHGLSYRVKPNFIITAGPVLRLNFSPEPGNSEFKGLVLEPRIWHEYLFAFPYDRLMLYHRLRIEHRWSKGNRIGDEWIYRDRWRYKFYVYLPLNKPRLMPGAWFVSPEVELIMQSGKPVGGSILDDLRLSPQIGYIKSTRVKYVAGLMWTTGQSLPDAYVYNTRWIVRFNVFLSLDFRKLEDKIPEIRIFD